MSANDYAIINGKPHLGAWFGSACIINSLEPDFENTSTFHKAKADLFRNQDLMVMKYEGLEARHSQLIVRPPCLGGPLQINGTIGLKWMLWGRAFKVKKFLRKRVKRYAKKFRGGKRKWVRVDKSTL